MMLHPVAAVIVCLCLSLPSFVTVVDGWVLPCTRTRSSPKVVRKESVVVLAAAKDDNNDNSWSVIDDWSQLSSEHPENATPDTESIFNQDLAGNFARDVEELSQMTEEDLWINDVVDEIHNEFTTLDEVSLYDTDYEESNVVHSIDDMGNEIAMLVRCNENPEELLISQGRALPPLSQEQKDDVSQLITFNEKEGKYKPTNFLTTAVSLMFRMHAKPNQIDGVLCMGRTEVANWMTKALKERFPTSPHDSRVLKTISDFGKYGTGRLLEEDLLKLYLNVIVGDDVSKGGVSPKRHLQLRHPFVEVVWRDLRNHGSLSPIEKEGKRLADEIESNKNKAAVNPLGQVTDSDTVMDECEILDWDYQPDAESSEDEELHSKSQASGDRSSHKDIEMAPNTKTPLFVRDGEFTFIDEESCIGCMQCANVAPNSFLMLDNGRARTFKQRNSGDVHDAVASCPVNCMHPVSYQELEEYETARDKGDGRTDHKHLGHRRGNTPLYVAGMDSDNNHRTSWYHTLKWKCVVSSECPQKGCYDCRKYKKPGDNPFFKKRLIEDEHVRAQYFIDRGDVDGFRKVADL